MAVAPLACVIGSMDLIRPLGLAGIRCASVSRSGALPRYSRFTDAAVEWFDPRSEGDLLLQNLIDFAEAQGDRPVLYYEGDWETLLISRHRNRLSKYYSFLMSSSEIVEALIDKEQFSALACRLELPVPAAARLAPEGLKPSDLPWPFPVLVKPLTRDAATWHRLAGRAKALRVSRYDGLAALWGEARAQGIDLMVQQLVPGPESAIESYHVYVDAGGAIAAEFTGRKVRTHPLRYGHSTALLTTDSADVAEIGAEVVRRIDLRGVAKLDFKRGPDGELWLLEVNPRFSLWHHLGAAAGLNIPALVYADLIGRARPRVAGVRVGARWSKPIEDFMAVRDARAGLLTWLAWSIWGEAKSGVALDDPMPLLRGGARFVGQAVSHAIHKTDSHPVRDIGR